MQRANQTQMIRRLVVSGMLVAVMGVLMMTRLGFIEIKPIQVTLYCLPVIIGVMTEGLGVGLLLGLAFGSLSFIQALGSAEPIAVFFRNPLISVIPRIFISMPVWLIVKVFHKAIEKNKKKGAVIRCAAAIAGSLTNTVLTLGAIYIACLLGVTATGLSRETAGVVLIGVASTNGLLEAALVALVAPPVMAALDRTVYKN